MMKRFLLPSALLLSPLAVLAQSNITSFVDVILTIINSTLVPLIIAIAFLWFIWGVFKYFISVTDADKEKGREYMIYGLIGFFVIISVWGLVNVLTGSFSLQNNVPDLPDAPTTGS